MKTANLTGALLDYWTARAEGVQADQLEIRPVQRPDPRTPDSFCVHTPPAIPGWMTRPQRPLDYSTNWALSGPLIEKHGIASVPFLEDDFDVLPPTGAAQRTMWGAFRQGKGAHYIDTYYDEADGQGDTPPIAICRAVVRAAFGDEVEDLPCV